MTRQPKVGDLLTIRQRGTNRYKTVVVTLGCDDIASDPGEVPDCDIDYNALGYPGAMPERPANVNALLTDLRSRVFAYEVSEDSYGFLLTNNQNKNWRFHQ